MNSTQNYGFMYNEFILDTSQNVVIKRTRKTQNGNYEAEKKLKKEIQFYKYVHSIPRLHRFKMPAIIHSQNHPPELHIEYFPGHEPLTERFPYDSPTESRIIIREILDCIHQLHENSPRVQVTWEEYRTSLRQECYEKIVERYLSIHWKNDVYPEFERLKYVNGIKVKSLLEYADIIRKRIEYIPNRYLTFIHGDTHLGNILVPKREREGEDEDISKNRTDRYIFIDPRGYYASYDGYGERRYDYAKLLFGISGYSKFDLMTIDTCDITEVTDTDNTQSADNTQPALNINIPFIVDYAHIYTSLDDPEWQSSVPELTNEMTRIISLSIWLGNNSTFVSPQKKLTSLMIARYLCERFLVRDAQDAPRI